MAIYKRQMKKYEEDRAKIIEEEERLAEELRDNLGLLDFPEDRPAATRLGKQLTGIMEE